MDFIRLVKVLFNLSVMLQVVSARLSDITSEDTSNTRKGITMEESNPVIKFKLGPFESLDDSFYSSDSYVESVKYNNMMMKERLMRYKSGRRPEQGKTGQQESIKLENVEEKQRRQLNWEKSNSFNRATETTDILALMNDIHDQIKKLKALPRLLANLRAELQETEEFLTLEPFEDLMKFLADEAENKAAMEERNRYNDINSAQYQIGNVFIFNRLPEDDSDSKLKQADVELLNGLKPCKMKDTFEKVVSSLKESPDPQASSQMNVLQQAQNNFLKIFRSQNVTLQQLNQMSKIVEFVERYHGSVSDLENFAVQVTTESRNNAINERSTAITSTVQEFLEKRNNERKVLVDDGFDIFKSEDMNEKTGFRRKG